MKICKYEILSEKDLWKVDHIQSEVNTHDLVLVVAETKNIEPEKLEKWLREKEKEELKKYASKIARVNFIVSRSILNRAFQKILEVDLDQLDFKRYENNKPYIENPQKIKFNLSHTEGCVMIGFSKKEIGVDIEKRNDSFEYKEVLESCFLSDERNFFEQDPKMFFQCWTAKEAYLKYKGCGFTRDPKEIEILCVGEKSVGMKDIIDEERKILASLNYHDEYLGAICLAEEL